MRKVFYFFILFFILIYEKGKCPLSKLQEIFVEINHSSIFKSIPLESFLQIIKIFFKKKKNCYKNYGFDII